MKGYRNDPAKTTEAIDPAAGCTPATWRPPAPASTIFSLTQCDDVGGLILSQLAQGREPRLRCLAPGGWPSPARCIAR